MRLTQTEKNLISDMISRQDEHPSCAKLSSKLNLMGWNKLSGTDYVMRDDIDYPKKG